MFLIKITEILLRDTLAQNEQKLLASLQFCKLKFYFNSKFCTKPGFHFVTILFLIWSHRNKLAAIIPIETNTAIFEKKFFEIIFLTRLGWEGTLYVFVQYTNVLRCGGQLLILLYKNPVLGLGRTSTQKLWNRKNRTLNFLKV